MQVACCLFVVYQVVDSGLAAADGACVAMTDRYGAELHRLGFEGEQTVGEKLAYAGEILQCLGCLDGAKHAGDGSEHSGL